MSREDGTNQCNRRKRKRLQRHPQDKGSEKYPNLIERAIHGFKVNFNEWTEVEHKGGLITLDPTLIQQHGKIREAVPIT